MHILQFKFQTQEREGGGNIVLCKSEVCQSEDTIDQALSIKTFQPTIIDPVGAPQTFRYTYCSLSFRHKRGREEGT
jgi:hypothetical protein